MPDKEENLLDTKARGKVFITSPLSYIINGEYYAAIAKSLGYEVKLNNSNEALETLNEIKNFTPDFLVMQMTFDKFRLQLEFLQNLKSAFPSIKIIATGEPFLTYINNVTYENPFIDYAIIGEAEYTLKDILDGLPDSEILGITYTDDNMQSAKNELRPLIENLDNLPFPARQLIKNRKELTIEVSRGCPFHCFFCLTSPIYGNKLRIRSVDNVIKELKECVNKFKAKKVFFKSDYLNFDINWLTDLCSKIIEEGVKIDWSCNIVPNNLDENLVKLMKKSGCTQCNIGIESGSEEILEKIGKNTTKEGIKSTVSLLKKYKIKTKGYFILGLPWETEETAEETTNFALELDTDEAVFNIGIPFPGTDFFVYGMLNKLFAPQTQFSNAHKNALVKTHTLTKERISELRDIAEKKFYSRPKLIIKSFFKRLFLKTQLRKFFS